MDTDELQYGKLQYRSVIHIERIFNSLSYYYINKLQMSIGCDKNHTFLTSSKFHFTKTKVKQFC